MAAVPPLPKSFEDAARHLLAVEEELERVCGSSHFRSSKRSCEFLQYIVKVTLAGRVDSLKERSIGIDLFGRDTSYEPSSDATVRVRANEVRKRLISYYAAPTAFSRLRIDLPTGSYVPRFLPASQPQLAPPTAIRPSLAETQRATVAVPPLSAIALMRPAVLALLVCILLLRHQLESREEYLRFWDHLLSGRNAMVLSLPPQDRQTLASSLYPLVWVAGRYGVDATLAGDSLTGIKQDSLASVQVSYLPAESPADPRLRWDLFTEASPHGGAAHRASLHELGVNHPTSIASAALLTILPEDAGTLRIQGTDAEAIRLLLEGLTVERNFPSGVAERLDNRHAFQILLFLDSSEKWQREVYYGES